jgi:hypothetical protein
MVISRKYEDLAASLSGKDHGTRCEGGRLGPTVGLVVLIKLKFSFPPGFEIRLVQL